MPKKETFLILGANSFSGASFIKFLLEKNHKVIATSRSERPHRALVPYLWGANSTEVLFHLCDINMQMGELKGLLRDHKPEYIVNFAAQSMVGQSWQTPSDWMQTNVVATTNLFNILKSYKHLRKYVHVTTPEVYGTTDGWIKENENYNPSTPYAVSRAAADMSLKTFVNQYDFPGVMTRAANVYGEGQQLYRIIPRSVLACLSDNKLTLDGGGQSTRVFIHMDDVSDATYKVALSGKVGDCYHISGSEVISIRDCVEKIVTRLNKNFTDCVEIGPERPGKDTTYMLDSSKIKNELGWQGRISLDEGLDRTIEWMNRFRQNWNDLPHHYNHKP